MLAPPLCLLHSDLWSGIHSTLIFSAWETSEAVPFTRSKIWGPDDSSTQDSSQPGSHFSFHHLSCYSLSRTLCFTVLGLLFCQNVSRCFSPPGASSCHSLCPDALLSSFLCWTPTEPSRSSLNTFHKTTPQNLAHSLGPYLTTSNSIPFYNMNHVTSLMPFSYIDI